MSGVDAEVLAWTAGVLGRRDVRVLRGLKNGGSPWLLDAGGRGVVLRVAGLRWADAVATEVEAMRLAAIGGVPVPEVLGSDDGAATGAVLLLMSQAAGSSWIPAAPDGERLRALGAAAARITSVEVAPSKRLPMRRQPIPLLDFAGMRREQGASALLRKAEAAVAAATPAGERTGFVHGDLWHGNTMWDGGALTAVIDWDCAGVGPAGVDLGSLRCDAVLCHGLDAAGPVLSGFEAEAGPVTPGDVAYWDLVAALSTPPDLGWFPDVISAQGRPDLTRELLLGRRDQFLADALRRLPG
jgi:Ser/Thr protein kinase RdoA (MazF antagonist)